MVKKEKIEEQINVKEEIKDGDCNLDDNVLRNEVKKEEITEEDPLSDTNNLLNQDPLEVELKQERIEDAELTVKEPEYDDMLAVCKAESADKSEFL